MLGFGYGERTTNALDDERHQDGGVTVLGSRDYVIITRHGPSSAVKFPLAAVLPDERVDDVNLSTQYMADCHLGLLGGRYPAWGSIQNENRTWVQGYVTTRHVKTLHQRYTIKNPKSWQLQTEGSIVRSRAPVFPHDPPS